jgi:hypothetical protein
LGGSPKQLLGLFHSHGFLYINDKELYPLQLFLREILLQTQLDTSAFDDPEMALQMKSQAKPSKGFGSKYYISAAWAVLRLKDSGAEYICQTIMRCLCNVIYLEGDKMVIGAVA